MANMIEPKTSEQKDQGIVSHLTMQGVGGAFGYFLFKYLEYAHGYHLDAGDESMGGTVFGAAFFCFWWLFGPRIKRWRNRR